MEFIKVSVIVPVYNVKSYLKECLDSLLSQTLDGIEIIMVNDGSTDGSESVAAEYADRYSNFKLINRENGGLSAARNTGLDMAKGKYVYFLDSDDFIAGNTLEILYNKAESNDLDQVRFSAYFFEDGTKDYKWTRDTDRVGYKLVGSYPEVMTGPEYYQLAIDNNDYNPNFGMIFTRRSVIEDNHLRFYEGILHEDELYNFKLTELCKRVTVIKSPLHYRRYRADSIITGENYLLKYKSIYICAEESERFIDLHPEISRKTAKWLNWYFAWVMMFYWEKMTKEEQKSAEVKDYFRKMMPLLKKNDNLRKSARLFNLNKSLYHFYINLSRKLFDNDAKVSKLIDRINSIKSDSHTIFWILTPVHGNIGDQAIAISERKMLDQLKVKYFEITSESLYELKKRGMLGILNGNPVLFHGGGYLGTLWFYNEEMVRDIISANPDSSVLFFPNTLYFDDDENGITEYKNSAEAYRAHKKLKIYAREKKSYDTLSKMGVNAGIAPDMVMMLKEDSSTNGRSGCLMLLRSDCEKTRSAETDKILNNEISKEFGNNITYSDTVLPDGIPAKRRGEEVYKFINSVRGSELVITDRLHGMILSAITGTPCIVINSKSHKLEGCYEWIKDLGFIRFCNEPDRLMEIYSEMPHGAQIYENDKLLVRFCELKEDILRLTK